MLSHLFESRGFEKIQTPSLEYYDVLEIGMGDSLKKIGVTLTDSYGQTLVLRPDHTVPIARLVSSRREELALPLLGYYINSIFRKPQATFDGTIESCQAGVECIGATGIESDISTIELCLEALRSLNITDIGIDIGYSPYFYNNTTDSKKALLTQDYIELGTLPQRGGLDIIKSTDPLYSIYTALISLHPEIPIHINKGLVPSLSYYSGLIFDVYSLKTSKGLAYGGRYDNLLGLYGWECPAIGFAYCVDKLVGELS